MSSRHAPEAGAGTPRSVSDPERYEIERLLGRGGFGEVYLARYHGRHGFSRRVALKVLRPEMAQQDELARRVRDEARVLGLVHHRAVVGVDRLVQIEGRSCIVMEYVEGASLDALVRESPFPVGAALEVIAEVCRALYACGAALGADGTPLRLLHRDIKPSNILVTRHGDVKLLDFGIAHAAFDGRESETRSLVFGTPGYMAPERFELQCGPEADVYALGVVLFEILVRQRFGRSSGNPARHKDRVDENMALLEQRRPDVPPEVVATMREVLSFCAADRPNASDLERRLVELVSLCPDRGLMRWAEAAVHAASRVGPAQGEDSNPDHEGAPGWTGRVVTEDRITLEASAPADPAETRFHVGELPTRSAAKARPPGRYYAPLALLCLLMMVMVAVRCAGTASRISTTEDARVESLSPLTPSAPLSTSTSDPKTSVPPSSTPKQPSAEVQAPAASDAADTVKAREGKPRSRRTQASVRCSSGEVVVDGNSSDGIEVLSGIAWSSVPTCVKRAPIYKVRRVVNGQTIAGVVTVGATRDRIVISCNTERCDGAYAK